MAQQFMIIREFVMLLFLILMICFNLRIIIIISFRLLIKCPLVFPTMTMTSCYLFLPWRNSNLLSSQWILTNPQGLDGLNLAFLKKLPPLWPWTVSLWGFLAGKWKSPGKTSIVLIPKKINPTTMKNFGLLFLCNVIYKIIFKVLANGLKHILTKCISQ